MPSSLLSESVADRGEGNAPLVRMSGIAKAFGAVAANEDVALDVYAGEVLALLGENGAGKSTLMKVLYGFEIPDAGSIAIDGNEVKLTSPRAAKALGIGMVFQQFSLVPALSVLENLLVAWPMAPWLPFRRESSVAVAERMHQLAPDLDVRRRVETLSVGERQLVELAKVLMLEPRLVILDEPTAVLSPPEAERLYALIRGLRGEGIAIVLITHKMADVRAVADRIVVMRRGRVVDRAAAGERTPEQLVTAMVGDRSAGALPPPPEPASRTPSLQLVKLSANWADGAIHDVTLEIAKGEIIGIAGVIGNGQYALAEVVAGLAPPASGSVTLDGRSIAAGDLDEDDHNAVAYIPERPLDNAVAPGLDLSLNLALRRIVSMPFFVSSARLRRNAIGDLESNDVRPPVPALAARKLSGGNLQKLVIARELSGKPAAIVACFPTMGLDVAATRAVYQKLFAHAQEGAAILWISEDLDDLLTYAHRIAVLHHGRIAGIATREQATRERIGAWMIGEGASMSGDLSA